VRPHAAKRVVTLGSLGVVLILVAAQAAAAGEAPSDAATPPLVDHREVIVPVGAGERIRIDNPLGHVVVRGWPGVREIHIVADKRAASDEQLRRLRVHYLAWDSGEITVDTRVDLGGHERALPLTGSRIDLVIDVPAGLEVAAKTFGGDLKVTGLRAGARLETTGGRIDVADVRGNVVTHQLRGQQQVASVEGDVQLDGVEGTMDLQGLGGGHLDARLVDGNIRAEDIRSEGVRLVTTTGDILFVGLVQPSHRYELRTYEGNVLFFPGERAQSFVMRTRAGADPSSALPMRVLTREGPQLQAVIGTGGVGREHTWQLTHGAAREGERAGDRPLVEIASTLGRVMIVAARSDIPARP